jgi:hypothetical protein
MKVNYEEVWEQLCRYKVIDPRGVFDQRSLIEQIKRNDSMGKIHFSLVYELVETDRFKRVVNENIQVQQTNKQDTVTDDVTYMIPKKTYTVYTKHGKHIRYMPAERRIWTGQEKGWIQQHRHLPSRLMLYKYYENFGPHRSVNSVMAKRYTVGRISRKKQKQIDKKETRQAYNEGVGLDDD